MRVALVTPMAPQSAVADVTAQAIPELGRYWELDVWCPTEPALRPAPVRVIPFDAPTDDVMSRLAAYDLVVYVLGNSPWHARILPLATRVPGLVVLHDASLTDMVRIAAIDAGGLDELVKQVADREGPRAAEVLEAATAVVDAEEWARFTSRVPLDEVALLGSLGVVVHSRWHASRVDGLTLGEVTVAPLPIPLGTQAVAPGSSTAPDTLDGLPDDAVLLVTLGNLNANRGLDLLVDALAGQPELERVHLWAIGPDENGRGPALLARASALGMSGRVAVPGRVPDDALARILARADAAAVLRDPVLEGQSASVLTLLVSRTPVIVLDHAHYRELPDDVAFKVDPADRLAGLRRALRAVVGDPEDRHRRGDRGHDWVLASRGAEAYAAALHTAGERATLAVPFAHALADVASRLQVLGLSQEAAVLDAATDVVLDLYGPR